MSAPRRAAVPTAREIRMFAFDLHPRFTLLDSDASLFVFTFMFASVFLVRGAAFPLSHRGTPARDQPLNVNANREARREKCERRFIILDSHEFGSTAAWEDGPCCRPA